MLVTLSIVVVGLQLIFLTICFKEQVWKRLDQSRPKLLRLYIIGQTVLLLILLIGGYRNGSWKSFNNFKEIFIQESTNSYQGNSSSDDPGLLKLVLNSNVSRRDTSSAQSFLKWQRQFRKKMKEDVFAIPSTINFSGSKYRVVSSEKIDANLSRLFIAFESFDQTEIPAYLFVHTKGERRPAIVVVPGHTTRQGESGIAQTGGLQDSYQNSVALHLAKAGYTTLTFELRGFGILGSPFNTEHRLVAYNAILSGSFYKAIISKDLKYGVDVLQTLPDVDSQRIGITGVSFGGEMAVAYAALDRRIKVTVFQGYGGRLGLLSGVKGSREQQPHYCHIIPEYNKYGFQEDMLLLLAPRPTLGIRGSQEPITIDSKYPSTVKAA